MSSKNQSLREDYEERSAILEYDAGYMRDEAEALAMEALWRFFERVTVATSKPVVKEPRTPRKARTPGEAERRKSHEAALKNLIAMGVLKPEDEEKGKQDG